MTDPLPKGTYTVHLARRVGRRRARDRGSVCVRCGDAPRCGERVRRLDHIGTDAARGRFQGRAVRRVDAARRDRRRRDRPVPRRSGGAADGSASSRASSPSSGRSGSSCRSSAPSVCRSTRTCDRPRLARPSGSSRNDDRGGLRRDLDTGRSLGAVGRRYRGGDRARAPGPRRARGGERHARAGRDDPVGPHARRRLLGRRTAAAGPAAPRAPRRPAGRGGAPLLEHGGERDRDRRGQRHHPGGRRARRLGRAPRHLAVLLRTHAGDQGRRRAPGDRPRRLQQDAQRPPARDGRPSPPPRRGRGARRHRRDPGADRHPDELRPARGHRAGVRRCACEHGRDHRQRLRDDDRCDPQRHARPAGSEPVPCRRHGVRHRPDGRCRCGDDPDAVGHETGAPRLDALAASRWRPLGRPGARPLGRGHLPPIGPGANRRIGHRGSAHPDHPVIGHHHDGSGAGRRHGGGRDL